MCNNVECCQAILVCTLCLPLPSLHLSDFYEYNIFNCLFVCILGKTEMLSIVSSDYNSYVYLSLVK